MPPASCPNCGADVPRNSKACPECGSDDETGWSDTAYISNLGISDEQFDHDKFVAQEFGTQNKPVGISWFWWITAIAMIGLLLSWMLRFMF